MPLHTSGFFSYLTIGWLTQLMIKSYRTGLTKLDLHTIPEGDQARDNAERLQRFWDEELTLTGGENPSFGRAVWRFARTRFIVAVTLLVISTLAQFLGPVSM